MLGRKVLLNQMPIAIRNSIIDISSEETIALLSALRIGANLNILRELPIRLINQLCVYTQPSHLQKLSKRTLAPEERDVVRAEYIREQLEKV